LIGLVRPDGGGATVAGVELRGDGVAVRRCVTFAPGEIALYGELSAHEQLDWLLRGRSRAALVASRAVAERLGLPLAKRVHEYSHGMKRQLLFAAAMGPDVRVRILDEPTEGLDPAKRSEVLELIAEDAKRGTTILLSSHHLSEVEEICDRLVFFFAGRVLADEHPAELRRLAERSARLEYATPEAASAAAAVFADATGVSLATAERTTLKLEFEHGGDLLARLTALVALGEGLAAPVSLELGRLSLTDLYERVYGVRGL
jgi:ABC-2 type transport system ATP-binding protein